MKRRVYVCVKDGECASVCAGAEKSRWLLYSAVKGGLTDRGSGHNGRLEYHKAP